MRKKPEFLIIGAQKAGTTSLFKYLGQHPDVVLHNIKEFHFFDLRYEKGIDWYTSIFPNIDGKITGEATPYYLFHPAVPERVKKHLPGIKLIVLLRNPVYRAYSHFMHSIKLLNEQEILFEKALQLERERLKDSDNQLALGEIQRHTGHQHNSYLSRGFYSPQLQRWLALFPQEQFLFIQSEHFFTSPQEHLNSVFRFLGLSPFTLTEFNIHNEGTYRHSLSKELYYKLMKQYVEDIKKTEELTGLTFDWSL
jgi:hypothetical protein